MQYTGKHKENSFILDVFQFQKWSSTSCIVSVQGRHYLEDSRKDNCLGHCTAVQ